VWLQRRCLPLGTGHQQHHIFSPLALGEGNHRTLTTRCSHGQRCSQKQIERKPLTQLEASVKLASWCFSATSSKFFLMAIWSTPVNSPSTTCCIQGSCPLIRFDHTKWLSIFGCIRIPACNFPQVDTKIDVFHKDLPVQGLVSKGKDGRQSSNDDFSEQEPAASHRLTKEQTWGIPWPLWAW
jgi:hypothetical protein